MGDILGLSYQAVLSAGWLRHLELSREPVPASPLVFQEDLSPFSFSEEPPRRPGGFGSSDIRESCLKLSSLILRLLDVSFRPSIETHQTPWPVLSMLTGKRGRAGSQAWSTIERTEEGGFLSDPVVGWRPDKQLEELLATW